MNKSENNFKFYCPVGIKKALDPETGEEQMLLGGIASTADKDADGEYLDPKGFDIKPLMKNGLVNWHHQAKSNPATIVGEPTKAKIDKNGLYIETRLYPSSQVARDIWELAKTLETDSKTRRLGYSIEGQVLKRGSSDRNNPAYKKVEKAVITGVAITHMPKNPKTFANIIKGELDDLNNEDSEDDEDDDTLKKEKSNKKKALYDKDGYMTKDFLNYLTNNKDKIWSGTDFSKFSDVKVYNFGENNSDYIEAVGSNKDGKQIGIANAYLDGRSNGKGVNANKNIVDIVKKYDDKKEEKALDTEDASALKREHVDGETKEQMNGKLGKAEVINRIFEDNPDLEFSKGKEIYTLIEKISNMSKKEGITEEDINKAYDALGLERDNNKDDVQKAKDSEGEEEEDPDAEEEDEESEEDEKKSSKKDSKKKMNSKSSKKEKEDKEHDEDEEEEENEDEDDEDEEDKGGVKKGGLWDRFDTLEKGIALSHIDQIKCIKALGILLKDSNDKLKKANESITDANDRIDALEDLVKGQDETISTMNESIEKYGSGIPAAKSIRHAAPVERKFSKGGEDELNREDSKYQKVSILNKAAISEILDEATFNGGKFDSEFDKACTHFEATGSMPANIIARLKNEYKIQITK